MRGDLPDEKSVPLLARPAVRSEVAPKFSLACTGWQAASGTLIRFILMVLLAFIVAAQPCSLFAGDGLQRGYARITAVPAADPLPDAFLNHDDEHNPEDLDPLPPLVEELWQHGGSYLYEPVGDNWNCPDEECESHSQTLRLPECWRAPLPVTKHQEFLGADPIHPRHGLKWFGSEGFQWEPRFVGHGSYEIFGIALEEGDRRQDGIGHQLLVDLDLRLTGTERFHAQVRPLGRKNTGGSFLQLNNPDGYDDNSTLIPDRYWFEGEIFSIFSGLIDDPFTPRDVHFVVGKFPFALHNNLLINDDMVGVVVNKNTITSTPLSNLNVQVFLGIDDIDSAVQPSPELIGIHATGDYRHALLEATYAHVWDSQAAGNDASYAAASATQFFGPLTLAGRALFKWDDDAGTGDGQLYVLESNFTRSFSGRCAECAGIEYGVFYANLFKATSGWNSISGGNFDRLRSTFEVNPLVTVSQFSNPDDRMGAAIGVQLFRHHEDQSFIPEVAYEDQNGTSVWGIGLGFLHKLGPRTFLDARGIRTFSSDKNLEREGAFVSTTVIF